MKEIFVTVQEFFENGGSLKIGRFIYNKDGNEVGEFQGLYDTEGEMILIKTSKGILPRYSSINYVLIHVKPIWK